MTEKHMKLLEKCYWFKILLHIILFYYKLIVTDLRKQQVISADPKEQITLTENLECEGGATTYFVYEETKGNILTFLQEFFLR